MTLTRIACLALLATAAPAVAHAQSCTPYAHNPAAVPQGAPNAPCQIPAFPEQTRVSAVNSGVAYTVTTVASGLQFPWAVDFLPDGRPVVTEKPGRLRVVQPDGSLLTVSGVPAVAYAGQGGLLDVLVFRDGATTRACLTYSRAVTGGRAQTAADCGVISTTATSARFLSRSVLWRQQPPHNGFGHFGSRVVRAPDGLLFITTGDRQDGSIRGQAQNPANGIGKTVRLARTRAIPADNPTWGGAGPSAIWSIGHRNIQGAAIHPVTGKLWTVEHGARGGDELNVPLGGRNHGWPIITYGIDYGGGPIGAGITQQAGMEQPLYYWDPSVAPGGMNFYTGALFPRWQGSLFIAGLQTGGLIRLELDGERVTGEERFGLGERVRDVAQGPDGAIYAVTDSSNGRLLKLAPR